MLFFLCVLCFIVITSSSVVALRRTMSAVEAESQYQALMDFYNATGGSRWHSNNGWATNQDPCPIKGSAWYGLQCEGDFVTEMHMSSNGLGGELPESIGNITGLEWFDVTLNGLFGHLPASMASLQALSMLWLDDNAFSGPLPDWIGNITSLTQIDAVYNHFNGPLPTSLGQLTGLQTLSITGNAFSGSIPDELGSLSLYELFVDDNDFSGLFPPGLCANKKLMKPASCLAGGNNGLFSNSSSCASHCNIHFQNTTSASYWRRRLLL